MHTHVDPVLSAVELSFCASWHPVALKRRSKENVSVVQAGDVRKEKWLYKQ